MIDNIDPAGVIAAVIVFSLIVGYIHEKWSGSGGVTSGGSKISGRKRDKKDSGLAKSKARKHKRSE